MSNGTTSNNDQKLYYSVLALNDWLKWQWFININIRSHNSVIRNI